MSVPSFARFLPSQVVDRAMSLLLELSQARRAALRSGEDARRAMESAYLAAQKQYAAHIDELNNQLILARYWGALRGDGGLGMVA